MYTVTCPSPKINITKLILKKRDKENTGPGVGCTEVVPAFGVGGRKISISRLTFATW